MDAKERSAGDWTFQYHGGSWLLGILCYAAYLGQISPWWLATAPFLLISVKILTIKF